MLRARCGDLAEGDVAEIRRFERLLRIWGRIDREVLDEVRKGRRRLAACRLVYGEEVNTWPAVRNRPAVIASPVRALRAGDSE